MTTTLLNILNNIYEDIEDDKSISLFGGAPGITLFKLYYLKHVRENDLSDIEGNIHELSELSINYNNFSSFCSGQAGINWFFNFLTKQEHIDKEDYKLIGATDAILAQASLDYLKTDCYDFLHGGLGIAHHLLYTQNKKIKPFFKKFLDGIIVLMGKDNPVLYHFDFDTCSLDKNKVNPSLSHGMASVLKFCLECYQNGIYKNKSKFIAKNIIDFLLVNMNTDHSYCYFPYVYDFGAGEKHHSRLSWCYGDLTIAYIMHQYGLLFDNRNVVDKALEILHHSANRRSENSSGVTAAGICHGSAGVAYIFNKLWYNTKDPLFYDAGQYWLQKTIDHSIHKDGLAGYKTFDAVNKKWINDSGLLEGVAGIGLTILSYLFEDYNWDYCLMLND